MTQTTPEFLDASYADLKKLAAELTTLTGLQYTLDRSGKNNRVQLIESGFEGAMEASPWCSMGAMQTILETLLVAVEQGVKKFQKLRRVA